MRLSSPAFASALAFVGGAHAWFRLPCTDPLVQTRIDPIIQPGTAPSYHVHTVHGAKNFRSNSTYQSLRASSCTSCRATQDAGFPKLYFRDPKTKLFEPVGNGGLLVYYLQRGDAERLNGGPGLKAFPEGFKMITGNPFSRSKKFATETGSQAELRERATKWACLRYTNPNVQSYEGYGFPTTDCEAGFQARLHMPSCWDGKNVDSADHVSHTAYLDRLDNGKCPDTHPVPLMHLFYEVTWDVTAFASRWTAADGWPFVYANGDPTGYGWHGDFQNGWDTQALQTAIDKCNDPSNDTINGVIDACQYLTLQTADTAKTCKATPERAETIDGKLAKLPGCNPLQYGPGDAALYTDANCPAA
ncbi:WSC domain containing protein [Ceratobasidium theobromae]|uniref:WSC domain containing protein n=1 Tax=Ceratobasidium theobromae TaxID=1582974 RepID=A0A5N5QSK6_9AGAM|nr:WSC domain containing protein [Ceratobasidium theobromae]